MRKYLKLLWLTRNATPFLKKLISNFGREKSSDIFLGFFLLLHCIVNLHLHKPTDISSSVFNLISYDSIKHNSEAN